jgi:UDP:flavonoid glycosyltransferase YjiC (YdhE family)
MRRPRLASHNLNFPRAIIGTGFFTPPPIHPTPNMRPWADVSPARLENADKKVLDVINRVLDRFDPPSKIGVIHELFQCEENFLTTFAELDPYARYRPKDTHYWGPVFAQSSGKPPIWSEVYKKKVFAYLKPEYGNCEAVLQALAGTKADILVFSPNLPQELVSRYQTAAMIFSREPFAMHQVVDECDVVVCHAGHDTIASALLAGRPLLLLPTQLEQVLLSKSVEQMGAGLICDTHEKYPEIQAKLQQLIAGHHIVDIGKPDTTNKIPNKATGLSNTERSRDISETIKRIVIRCGELVTP